MGYLGGIRVLSFAQGTLGDRSSGSGGGKMRAAIGKLRVKTEEKRGGGVDVDGWNEIIRGGRRIVEEELRREGLLELKARGQRRISRRFQ